jgi:hypothetical protein
MLYYTIKIEFEDFVKSVNLYLKRFIRKRWSGVRGC